MKDKENLSIILNSRFISLVRQNSLFLKRRNILQFQTEKSRWIVILLTLTLCELLDKSISYSLKKPTYFNLSFMITGLESISLCFCQTNGKIHHLLLTSVTQNNMNKCTEERPIKQFSLTLNLVFHNRPHICPTFCLPTWPVLHSGILSSKFFEVCSSRFMHYRPSQDQHRLRTSSL